jgi:hypothetical protein
MSGWGGGRDSRPGSISARSNGLDGHGRAPLGGPGPIQGRHCEGRRCWSRGQANIATLQRRAVIGQRGEANSSSIKHKRICRTSSSNFQTAARSSLKIVGERNDGLCWGRL